MIKPTILHELEAMDLEAEWNGARSLRFDCPECDAKKKLLFYPDNKGGWCQCIGCGKNWGMYEFLIKIIGYSPKQAWEAKHDAIHSQFNMHELMAEYAPKIKYQVQDRKLWISSTLRLLDQAKQEIKLYPGILKWLKNKWGIRRKAALKADIGFISGDVFVNNRTEWGLVENRKLNGEPKKLWLPAGLVIPKFYPNGCLSSIRFKNIDTQAKWNYQVLPGSSYKPFRLGNRDSDTIVFVEHEFDAILVNQEFPDVYVIALVNPLLKISKTLASNITGKTIITVTDFSYSLSDVPTDIKIQSIGNRKTLGAAHRRGLNLRNWLEL